MAAEKQAEMILPNKADNDPAGTYTESLLHGETTPMMLTALGAPMNIH